MDHRTYLKRVRIIHYILLLCAVFLIAFGTKGLKIAGVAVLALGIFIVWKFHRCPKCHGELDTRWAVQGNGYCPICGYDMKTDTDR